MGFQTGFKNFKPKTNFNHNIHTVKLCFHQMQSNNKFRLSFPFILITNHQAMQKSVWPCCNLIRDNNFDFECTLTCKILPHKKCVVVRKSTVIYPITFNCFYFTRLSLTFLIKLLKILLIKQQLQTVNASSATNMQKQTNKQTCH